MKYVIYKDNHEQIKKAITSYIDNLDGTHEISVKPYDDGRSAQQNRLQREWCNQLAKQGDNTSEWYRAHSKLHIGIAIMRQDDDFKDKYDRIIKPLPYEQKMELMAEPFDFPVTRLMNKKQAQQYLDEFQMYWAKQGYILTTTGE